MNKKLFDFCIGNPPYNLESVDGNGRKPPIYHLFMDECFKFSNTTELITPARFLFDAGQTPHDWNLKMLNDEHFKVVKYEPDSKNIFPSLVVPIKGGIVITLRDNSKKFGKIGSFIDNDNLRNIVFKIDRISSHSINEIHHNRSCYRFTSLLYEEHPNLIECFRDKKTGSIKTGDMSSISSNVFEKFNDGIFFLEKPDEDKQWIKIIGRENNKRIIKYIDSRYIRPYDNIANGVNLKEINS